MYTSCLSEVVTFSRRVVKMARESIDGFIFGALQPPSSEVVWHDSSPQALQATILDFILAMSVKDWDEGVMICDYYEVLKSV